MKMKHFVAVALTASAVFSVSPTFAAGDAASGKAKAAMCASCHGADGNSVNPDWPKLAGQHANYLVKQLEDFKKGTERSNPLMAGMVASLTKTDMENLAAYFSTQKSTYGKADPALVDLGEKIYRGGNKTTGVPACMACHGPNGAGNPQANFPALSGQHAKYVATQLKAFRDGQRSNDAGAMMRNIAAKMTDQEIEAVASYVQGLH